MGMNECGYKQELKRALTLADLLAYGLVLITPTAAFAAFGRHLIAAISRCSRPWRGVGRRPWRAL